MCAHDVSEPVRDTSQTPRFQEPIDYMVNRQTSPPCCISQLVSSGRHEPF